MNTTFHNILLIGVLSICLCDITRAQNTNMFLDTNGISFFEQALVELERGKNSLAMKNLLYFDSLYYTGKNLGYFITLAKSPGSENSSTEYYSDELSNSIFLKEYAPERYRNAGSIFYEKYCFEKAIWNFEQYLKVNGGEQRSLVNVTDIISSCYDALDLSRSISRFQPGQHPVSDFLNDYDIASHVIVDDQYVLYYSQPELKAKDNNWYAHYPVSEYHPASDTRFCKLKISGFNNRVINLNAFKEESDLLFFEYEGNIYSGVLDEAFNCSNVKALSGKVNSKFVECDAEVSKDVKTIYFSSNRPGGYGGFDIYIGKADEKGRWREVKNAGPEVNSPGNERFSRISNNGNILYFSSDGHGGIGDKDIFFSEKYLNLWTFPENLGFPVNSVMDDHLSAITMSEGNLSLYVTRKDLNGDQEINRMYEKPLGNILLVKGKVTTGVDSIPSIRSLYVYQGDSIDPVETVYHPNKITGKYLLFLSAGYPYEMVLEIQGSIPYHFKMGACGTEPYVEITQEINITPQIANGQKVGENISIRNRLSDVVMKDQGMDGSGNDYLKLLGLVEDIIEKTDKKAMEVLHAKNKSIDTDKIKNKSETYNDLLDEIEHILVSTDSIQMTDLRSMTVYDSQLKITTDIGCELKDVILGVDTFNVGGSWNVQMPVYQAVNDDLVIEQEVGISSWKESNGDCDQKNPVAIESFPVTGKSRLNHSFFFTTNGVQLNKAQVAIIQSIAIVLIKNPELSVEIRAFADTVGDVWYNELLSKKRAEAIEKIFIKENIYSSRITTSWYGESFKYNDATNDDNAFRRRAEIRIVGNMTGRCSSNEIVSILEDNE